MKPESSISHGLDAEDGSPRRFGLGFVVLAGLALAVLVVVSTLMLGLALIGGSSTGMAIVFVAVLVGFTLVYFGTIRAVESRDLALWDTRTPDDEVLSWEEDEDE